MAGTFIGEPWKQPYTAQQLQDAATHQVPIIGANGNFWRWDIATSAYVDTGVLAGAGLPDGSVTTPKLADGAVTWPKLAPEARKSNPNLLDNAYFIGGGSQQGGGQFPINQRGLTEYVLSAAGYTIDRWKARNAQTTVRIKPDYIEFEQNANGYQAGIGQPIENFAQFIGQTLTFSILAKGDGINAPKISSSSSGLIVVGSPSTDWQLVAMTYTPNSSEDIPRIYASINNDNHPVIGLQAAKLELGPYQTLAHESAGGVDTKQSPQLQR